MCIISPGTPRTRARSEISTSEGRNPLLARDVLQKKCILQDPNGNATFSRFRTVRQTLRPAMNESSAADSSLLSRLNTYISGNGGASGITVGNANGFPTGACCVQPAPAPISYSRGGMGEAQGDPPRHPVKAQHFTERPQACQTILSNFVPSFL